MAIIDPRGLYYGERLRKCSDSARLYWPYLFLAANGFGRLEINLRQIIEQIFIDFKNPPAEEGLADLFLEYRDNHLIFLYESSVGEIWGQWYCKQNCLPRFKTAADHRSPAPPEPEYSRWLSSYIPESKSLPKSSEIVRKLLRNPSEIVRSGEGVGVGVGVGVGEGVGKGLANTSATNSKKPLLLTAPQKSLDTWLDAIYMRHPLFQRKNKNLMEDWAVKRWKAEEEAGKDPNALFAEIDRVHQIFCKCEEWTKDNGRWTPPLITIDRISGHQKGWLPDEGWREEPVRNKASPSSDDEAAYQRALAEEKAAWAKYHIEGDDCVDRL